MSIDLLRRDECQPLTTEQMEEIKSQFHPSSTANVNIVPYEIYDEDEHIVGEWRETIDGVKKKKPVYEKTYSFTISNTSETISVDIPSIDVLTRFDAAFKSNSNVYENPYFVSNTDQFRVWIEGDIKYTVGSSYPTRPIKANLTIQYTKTTDEWEEV